MELANHQSRVMLVDDDIDLIAMVSEALHGIGWHVSNCTDPGLVVEMVATERPHVILLDIFLHGRTSGWQTLQALQSDMATSDVPVIVFSGGIRELEEKEAWLLQHHIGVLSKPFDLEDLYDAVQEYQQPWILARPKSRAKRTTVNTVRPSL